ncbi:MAG: HD domain-containing protein [Candidatus Diapherotrites archaeon]
MAKKKDLGKLLNFFYELGQLKRVARSGWWLAGVKNPESVAEHAWRTAAVSYVLGLMEKADAQKCALISLFHEMPECRVNDSHKLMQRYVDAKKFEEKALKEQLDSVPREIGIELKKILEGYGREFKEMRQNKKCQTVFGID